MLSDTDTLNGPERHGRTDSRLARVVYIGAAMIAAYGPLRAARFMHARGVPPCVLVPVLRLGDRRRNDVAMRRALLPAQAPHVSRGILPVTARQRERETI